MMPGRMQPRRRRPLPPRILPRDSRLRAHRGPRRASSCSAVFCNEASFACSKAAELCRWAAGPEPAAANEPSLPVAASAEVARTSRRR